MKLCREMRQPRFGEASMGAVTGAIVGGIGGLFAMQIAPAILTHDAALLFSTPILGLMSWMVSGPSGWVLGGQFGPRLGDQFRSQNAEIVGGVIGGLIPVALLALWGWRVAVS